MVTSMLAPGGEQKINVFQDIKFNYYYFVEETWKTTLSKLNQEQTC